MKNSKSLTIIFCFTLILLNSFTESTNFDYKVLKGAKIFDGNGRIIDNGIIVIKSDKIESIGDKTIKIPVESEVIDVTGKFITPGFIDSHIHISSSAFYDSHAPPFFLADSISLAEVTPIQRYQYERYFEAYLRSGVTAVYNVGGASWTLDLQRNNINNHNAPHFFSTGQIINAWYDWPEYDPIFVKPKDVNQGREMIEWLTSLGAAGIKIYELNLEDENHLKVIRAVAEEVENRNNWIVAHAMNLNGAKEIVKIGATVLVHSVVDNQIDVEFIQLLKERNVIYTPNLSVFQGYMNARKVLMGESIGLDDTNKVLDQRTVTMWNDANSYFGLLDSVQFTNDAKRQDLEDKKRIQTAYQNLKAVYDAGILISVGTDAGNPGTHHGISYVRELEMMQEAGIPPNELLVMATKNGAMSMHKEKIIGTLEPGKIADLVIMEEDPSENISNVRSLTHVMHYGVLRSVKQNIE